jgi:methylenetetrahydrofolate dehydrogenase (NADP+)/methenyltetrahydrofolate cyclohydrolase
MIELDPSAVAQSYLDEIKAEIDTLPTKINVVGFIATDDLPSISYARATRQKFNEIGMTYDLREIERLDLEQAISESNEDPAIHGIFIYFPVFHNQQDNYLRNLVDFRKDIEAGSMYWVRKLYANDRLALENDPTKKALLPCTPLAIIKMLTAAGVYGEGDDRPIEGKRVTIFNRSEVNGRPLAVMMSNDGATVYSFDINGPLVFENARPSESRISRAAALAESDIVITGVPNKSFEKVRCDEIRPGTACLNFSSFPNFDDDINTHTDTFIPKVGPMTVAMCMRNTVRLFRNFHVED